MSNQAKRLYEAMFLVDSALATSDWDGIMGAIQTVFDRANADVVSIRKWDEARLAYPVKRCTRGTYILTYFRADSGVVTGFERDVKLNETFLRVLVLNGDHLNEEMMAAPTPSIKASEMAKQQEDAEALAKEEAAAKAAEKESAVAVAEPGEGGEGGVGDVEFFDDLPEVEDDKTQGA